MEIPAVCEVLPGWLLPLNQIEVFGQFSDDLITIKKAFRVRPKGFLVQFLSCWISLESET